MSETELQVDNGAWDGPAVMSAAAQSDDPAAFYRAVCAGRRSGDPALQSSWALPHHREPGADPNAAGVRNSLSRLPQTQGLVNAQEAQRHLDAHMAVIRGEASADDLQLLSEEHVSPETELELGQHVTLDLPETELTTLSLPQRRMGLRLLEYNKVVTHPRYGPLMFEPGAFVTDLHSGSVDPVVVRLRMDHEDPPTGLGRTFTDKPDAPYMEFQLSRTQRADEQLTLAKDGVSRGASVGFNDIPSRVQTRQIGGESVRVYPARSALLGEVSTTWQPTFEAAGVTYMLHKEHQEGEQPPMAEENTAPVAGAPAVVTTPGFDYEKMAETLATALSKAGSESKMDQMLAKFDEMVELQRENFKVPDVDRPKPILAHWVEFTLRRMRGENLSSGDVRRLALDDVIISEQPGLVPDVFTADYDDLINQDRPFLTSTRQITAPSSGDTLTLPVITTRAVAGTQSEEKAPLTTTATKVGTGVFNYQSVFGGADLSIQFINRAQPGFFEVLTGDMGMAYALDCELKAIDALLTGYTDSAGGSHVPTDGGVMDPTAPHFGDAWITSITSGFKRAPTDIWLSAAGVGAFIDAVSPSTNAPLYSNLAAAFTAGAGVGGVLSGLRPHYVPAMDGAGVDVIIGPARGFLWAEDPARTLQADVPSIAGRDIALAGGLFPAPRYADAFTYYTVSS